MFAFVQTGCVSLRKGTVERCPEEETGSLKGGEKAWKRGESRESWGVGSLLLGVGLRERDEHRGLLSCGGPVCLKSRSWLWGPTPCGVLSSMPS